MLEQERLIYFKNLLKKISIEEVDKRKAFLYFRLYLLSIQLLNDLDNDKAKKSKDTERYLNAAFEESVEFLCQFYNCESNYLPEIIRLDLGKWMHRQYAYIDQRDEVIYLGQEEAKFFKAYIESGHLYRQKLRKNKSTVTKLSNMNEDPYEENIFVLSTSGILYLLHRGDFGKIRELNPSNYRFKHSSFLSSDEVLFAGRIIVENGEIKQISDESAHYNPNNKNMIVMLLHLESLGVDITSIKLKIGQGKKSFEINAAVFLEKYNDLQICSLENIEQNKLAISHENIVDEMNRSEIQLLEEFADIKETFKKNDEYINLRDRDSQYSDSLREKRTSLQERAKGEESPNIEMSELLELNSLIIKSNNVRGKRIGDYFSKKFADYFYDKIQNGELKNIKMYLMAIVDDHNRVGIDSDIFKSHLQKKILLGQVKFDLDSVFQLQKPAPLVSDYCKFDSEEILSALHNFIVDHPWQLDWLNVGGCTIKFFDKTNQKNSEKKVPDHVRIMLDVIKLAVEDAISYDEAFENVLRIGQNEAFKNSFQRSKNTQNFYNLFSDHSLVRFLMQQGYLQIPSNDVKEGEYISNKSLR